MSAPRLVTFDCYGTLIDWYGGLRQGLGGLVPGGADLDLLCARYVELEAEVEAGAYLPYREVMARTLEQLLGESGVSLPPDRRDALGRSLPGWVPFPDAPPALARLATRFDLGILSNIDDDLLAASVARLGIEPRYRVTAAQVRSYKPAEAHFRRVLELSGLAAHQVLHVAGSLRHDVEVARRLGFRPLWINRLGEPRPGWLPAGQELPDLTRLPELAAA